MRTKAVIYARVSSVSDRQDTSRQIEDLRKYANLRDIEVVATFEEHISGAKKMRNAKFLRTVWNTALLIQFITCYYLNFPDWAEVHYKCFAH